MRLEMMMMMMIMLVFMLIQKDQDVRVDPAEFPNTIKPILMQGEVQEYRQKGLSWKTTPKKAKWDFKM